MKIGVVIPTYDQNPETTRCMNHLIRAAHNTLGDFEFKYFVELGPKIAVVDTKDPAWNTRDRAIAKCRWDGTSKAFEWGAEWAFQIDTDVMVPPDFFYHMLNYLPNVEAKTCHVLGTGGAACRHVGWPNSVALPCDTQPVPIAGEVIVLRRALWERMDKKIAENRANEDYEIAEKVRAAGAMYWVVPVKVYSD